MTEAPVGGVTRALFRERQLLRAADLEAEQSYHVSMRRRHHIGAHGWGVVRGLVLDAATPGGPFVEAGMAVDGYGRELFVEERLSVPADAFDRLGDEEIDVWLVYDRVEETTPQRGRFDCGPGRGNRWRESSRLRLTPARGADPRAPGEVPDADLDFGPHEKIPDDAARPWPVFLGTLRRVPAGGEFRYEVARRERPSATLVGEVVHAPSGRARMQVGAELASQTRRFAVLTPDAEGAFIERLAIDREGKIMLRGETTLDSNLTFGEEEAQLPTAAPPRVIDHCAPSAPDGADDAAHALFFQALAATPPQAAPWQVYRTTITKNDARLRQLRFEIGHPGDEGDPALYALSVGRLDGMGGFHACLSVTADCRVVVAGDLRVEGRIIEGPIKPDPSDPRFTNEMLDQFTKGQDAASQPGIVTQGLRAEVIVLDAGASIVPETEDLPEHTAGHILGIGANLLFAVRVVNTLLSAITHVQLYGKLTFKDANGTAEMNLTSPAATLGREAELVIPPPGSAPFVFDGADTLGEITIAVTVIGVGPLLNVISATDTVKISVQIIPT